MFFLSSAHISLGLRELFEGFVYKRDSLGGPNQYFQDYDQSMFIAKQAVFIINVSFSFFHVVSSTQSVVLAESLKRCGVGLHQYPRTAWALH